MRAAAVVGSAAVQLAHAAGAVVYTTVSSPAKMAKVKALGAAVIIDYKQQDFKEAIHVGIDVIIDFVGASYLERHLQLLNVGGRLIQVGLMGGTRAEMDLSRLLHQRLQLKGLMIRKRSLEDKRAIHAPVSRTLVTAGGIGRSKAGDRFGVPAGRSRGRSPAYGRQCKRG